MSQGSGRHSCYIFGSILQPKLRLPAHVSVVLLSSSSKSVACCTVKIYLYCFFQLSVRLDLSHLSCLSVGHFYEPLVKSKWWVHVTGSWKWCVLFSPCDVFGADLWIKDAVLLYFSFITELGCLEIKKACKEGSRCAF